MRLAKKVWGRGERTVVLLHGMMGASSQYYEVGPALAARGYRVVAVDLPGHGESPKAPDADLNLFVESVVETVGVEPELAIGHSLGAVVLASALPVLRPARAVYVDVPFLDEPREVDTDEMLSKLTTARATRTVEHLRITKPMWSEQDRKVEAEAARQFDPQTATALEVAHGKQPLAGPPNPSIPSLLIRADPSRHISAKRAAELQAHGFEVKAIPGAGHSVWYGHLDQFLQLIDEFRTQA
jgi:pimeloyl-ACP methyl ester carboxylesterase